MSILSMSILTLRADAQAFAPVRPILPGLAFSATAGVFIYLGDRALDSAYLDGLLIALVLVIAAQIVQRRRAVSALIAGSADNAENAVSGGWRWSTAPRYVTRYVPWFMLGFILLSTFRSFDVIGEETGAQVRDASKLLFTVAMVGIGLGVDLRSIVNVGPRVALTIVAILTFMITLSLIGGSFLDAV